MLKVKDNKQQELFDSWGYLSPKRRKMLDESWPGLFREHILEQLPVDKLKPFFHATQGRFSKEAHAALGAALLQQMFDFTDYETVEQFGFNIMWHFALNITGESDEAKYISLKTIWNIRRKMTEHNLDQTILESISGKLAEVFNVDTDKQRLDSVHIHSNMRKLGRVGIFSRSIEKFLVNLKRRNQQLFEDVPENIRTRYLSKKSMQAFSMVKPSNADKTLKTLSADLCALVEIFKNIEMIENMSSYKQLVRVLDEQCHVQYSDEGYEITVKPCKEVPSDSLQNPSDPDASYSGHKGQGYQVQIMETFTTETEDRELKAQTLNLITHVEVQKACEHDTHALLPAIENAKEQGLDPKVVLADSLYGSDENVIKAQSLGVEVTAPAMSGGGKEPRLIGFSFDENGRITSCTAGRAPSKVKYKEKKERFRAYFNLDVCLSCPNKELCPGKAGKKQYYVRYMDKERRSAQRWAVEKTEAFIEAYRWRAGVEATMSQYDRLTGVKHLRVRGIPAVRFAAILKAAGLNLLRAVLVKKARKRANKANNAGYPNANGFYLFFKEQISLRLTYISKLLVFDSRVSDTYIKLAA